MELYVARQPIFDIRRRVVGYELLYRRSAGARSAQPTDPNRMSSDVIVQNFLEAGLDRLTEGLRGYVNFTREMLIDETFRLFDPRTVVIELVEDIVADREVVDACRALTSAGYKLALDDFVAGGIQEPLLRDAHIVKVDTLGRSTDEINRIAAHLRPHYVQMLAERVETPEMAWTAEKAGFTLFQGYYYSKPVTFAHKSTAIEALHLLPLLNLVQSDDSSQREIERIFKSDPGLSYKLLQIAQSATNGAHGVDSIRHALTLVGRNTLARWVVLLIASSLAGAGVHSPELLKQTLLRARFMELLGGRSRVDSGPLFLVGLFSNMDALLQLPLPELLQRVKFSSEVERALRREESSMYFGWLRLAEAYEQGRWATVNELTERIGIQTARIPEHYLRSVEWASETLEMLVQQEARQMANERARVGPIVMAGSAA